MWRAKDERVFLLCFTVIDPAGKKYENEINLEKPQHLCSTKVDAKKLECTNYSFTNFSKSNIHTLKYKYNSGLAFS